MSSSTSSKSQINSAYNEGWYEGLLIGLALGVVCMAIDIAHNTLPFGGSRMVVVSSDGRTVTTKRGWFW